MKTVRINSIDLTKSQNLEEENRILSATENQREKKRAEYTRTRRELRTTKSVTTPQLMVCFTEFSTDLHTSQNPVNNFTTVSVKKLKPRSIHEQFH
jgi:hypothetical protein